MIRFLYKTILLGIFSIAVITGIIYAGRKIVGCQYETTYNAAIVDKLNRLNNLESPKIILVGNSNLAFGMFSNEVEAAFGMSVVNLGIHGGLGNAFHEDLAKLNIGEGDIIVVCHTTYSDKDSIDDKDLAWVTIEYHEDAWNSLRLKDILELIPAYRKYFMSSYLLKKGGLGNLQQDELTSYARDAFNEYGDIVRRPGELETSFEFTPGVIEVPQINNTCISRLNVLNRYIESKGAKMVIAGYPIADGEYTPDRSEYEAFQKKLVSSVECEVISNFVDYLMPYDSFYNTHLHLNSAGAEHRTKLLIHDLEKWGLTRVDL